MTELILTPDELDDYVRSRVDTVLLGKYKTTARSLHIPAQGGSDGVACDARTERDNGWQSKPINVYPPGHHRICPWCAEQRFGIEVMDGV